MTKPETHEGTGGEKLSAKAVSELPLNKRDFSQLLLLAAGTMTDTNGAANFTQQFAVNGQRGTAAVFAMDGADSSDPEMGGATFTNFNVDAVAEIRSSSGWTPAEIGRGASGFTDIITRSGGNAMHGSLFEFLRNAALDARNFFDRRSLAQPGRIPPFIRNEFGLTNGGPVFIPGGYDGRNRTFYFAEYQGFRQVLSDTEVIPVPSAAERSGLDTTAYPGDTLIVPVDPRIAKVLARYPLPNDPEGPYGARTLATSSKVTTVFGPVFHPPRSQALGKIALVRALHHGQCHRSQHQPQPDRDRSGIRRGLSRSPAQRGHYLYAHPIVPLHDGVRHQLYARHSLRFPL